MPKIQSGAEADITLLDELITKFNLLKVPFPRNPPWYSLCFIVKQDAQLLGGIYGHLIMDNILSVDVLYVRENLRHQGYGKQLLNRMEATAKEKGAYLAQLDTFDFQALEFYLKQGYEVFGTLENCPAPRHRRYYLKKYL